MMTISARTRPVLPVHSVGRPSVLPQWHGLALIASGIVVMALETPSVLFFLGLLFTAIGVWLAVAGRRARQASPTETGVAAS